MTEPCDHLRVGDIRWDIKPNSVLVIGAGCGAEATVWVAWDDRDWGDD